MHFPFLALFVIRSLTQNLVPFFAQQDYLLTIYTQCFTFPHSLVFFLKANLEVRSLAVYLVYSLNVKNMCVYIYI